MWACGGQGVHKPVHGSLVIAVGVQFVVSLDEGVGKVRAAHDVRQRLDPDFLIIARSDARGANGGSLDAAIERVNAYLEAGADMAFVEGPTTREEVIGCAVRAAALTRMVTLGGASVRTGERSGAVQSDWCQSKVLTA